MNPPRHASVWTMFDACSVRCNACNETTLALLQLFNEEPASRFPYDLKVRVDDDIQSGFVIRAHGVRGDELKCQVQTFITEKPTTWFTEKRTGTPIFETQ